MYQGPERRQSHDCIQEQNIGKFKEFMSNYKGVKATLFIIAWAIAIQVGTFLYLWGGLVTTVTYHDKTIDKILNKLENVNIIGVERRRQ